MATKANLEEENAALKAENVRLREHLTELTDNAATLSNAHTALKAEHGELVRQVTEHKNEIASLAKSETFALKTVIDQQNNMIAELRAKLKKGTAA